MVENNIHHIEFQYLSVTKNHCNKEQGRGGDEKLIEAGWRIYAGLDLNFQGHLSVRTSEIRDSPVLYEMSLVH